MLQNRVYMRKLSIILTLVAVIACYQTIFAAPVKQDSPEEQKKMAQLQQLLTQTMQGSAGQTPVADIASVTQASLSDSQGYGATPQAGQVGQGRGQVDQRQEQAGTPDVSTTTTALKATNAASASGTGINNIYDEAFSNVVNQTLPMSPEQITKLREVFNETQFAASTSPGVPPRPTSSSLLVNLSPKAVPPVIRLGVGRITSMVFVDTTGQPWPIASYSLADPSAFNIQWDKKGNTLLVQASTYYKRANMAVILRDLNTPVMIDLIAGQEALDYRVDLRVPGLGPNAIYSQSGLPDSANPILLDVLHGIAPKGSKELRVGGCMDCRAWLLKDKLYLRTNLTIISPGWLAIMNSIDGTSAYQMPVASVILALQKGRDKKLTLTLEGIEYGTAR